MSGLHDARGTWFFFYYTFDYFSTIPGSSCSQNDLFPVSLEQALTEDNEGRVVICLLAAFT